MKQQCICSGPWAVWQARKEFIKVVPKSIFLKISNVDLKDKASIDITCYNSAHYANC